MEAIFKMRRAHRHGHWDTEPVHVHYAKERHGEGPEGFEPRDLHWGGRDEGPKQRSFVQSRRL